jgi:hypothetical protein
MAEVVWYYAKNERQLGPVAPSELRRLATTGGLLPTDLIWREGMEGWAPAAKVKGLFSDQATPGLPEEASAALPIPPIADASEPAVAGFETPASKTSPASERFVEPPLNPATEGPAFGEALRTSAGFDLVWLSQIILWGICVAIVLFGGVLFARALLRAQNATEEMAAGATYSTFFIGAYVVARAGERVAALLQAHFNRSGKS